MPGPEPTADTRDYFRLIMIAAAVLVVATAIGFLIWLF